MRYVLGIILCIWCIASTIVAQAAHNTNTQDTISTLSNMRLCVVESNPPFAFRDSKGELQGFNVDVWNAINIPYAFSYKRTDLPTALAALQSGYCSMTLTNISITPQRAQRFAFSDPYLRSSIGIMVRGSETSINSVDDLQDKSIAVLKGSTAEQFVMQTLKGGEVLALNSENQLHEALLNNKADAIVNDIPTMQHFLSHEGQGFVRILPLSLFEQDYAYGFTKGVDEVRDSVNAAIARLHADGTIDKLYEKWFGASPYVTPIVRPTVSP